MRLLASLRLACLFFTMLPFVQGQDSKKTVTPPEPRVGAYYFYWYRYPDRHFTDSDGSDGLFQHFSEPKAVDFRSVDWHRREVESMMDAGLDLILPVYWGIPDKKLEALDLEFADIGLEALVKALDRIEADGGKPPKIGLFYDTSTLLHRTRGEDLPGTIDLRTDSGRGIFMDTITRFFSIVPERHRFKLDEFLLVVLYSSFGAPHERDFLVRVGDELKIRLGAPVFIVAEESWSARSHSRYRWGSALNGPTGDPVVQTIGPGYNDTTVPGRGTPIRDREETRFYLWSWDKVLLARPSLVFIETWNEFHEGTGIAPCAEHGETYVDITRRYVKKLKDGILPDVDRPVRLAHPTPLPRPDTGWWRGGPDRTDVSWRAAAADLFRGDGLRLVKNDDGPFKRNHLADRTIVETDSSGKGVTYLYFGIADEFANDTAASYDVEVDFIDGDRGTIALQYDSWDLKATHRGAYKETPSYQRTDSVSWRIATFHLPDARFSNRQNGGADFRIACQGSNVAVGEVRVRRLETKLEGAPSVDVR